MASVVNKGPYKYCLVPECKSTSLRTPDKIFVSLPAANTKQKYKRKLWLNAMGRNENDLAESTRGHVCENHFNVSK